MFVLVMLSICKFLNLLCRCLKFIVLIFLVRVKWVIWFVFFFVIIEINVFGLLMKYVFLIFCVVVVNRLVVRVIFINRCFIFIFMINV